MRILLVCYVFPPEHTTAGVMLQELAEDLAARGHRVTVLTGWPGYLAGRLPDGWRMRWRQVEERPEGYRVIRSGHPQNTRGRMVARLWFSFSFAVTSFVNALFAGPFDVVFNDSTPIFGVWSMWLLARCKRATLLYSIQDLYPEAAERAGLMRKGLTYRVLRTLDGWLCRLSDRVITLSDVMKRLIVARGVSPGKVEVFPLWLDAAKVRPLDRDNAWRREQAIPPEVFVALYAGTIGHVSGASFLIDVGRRLRDRPDILLLFVGEGPLKDELRRGAEAEGMAGRGMRFLPFQPGDRLSELQATADVSLVTLLPEAGETSVPSKILGYMAAGRPVLASVRADSPTAEVIRAAGCGKVLPCQDAAALADEIRALADAPQSARVLGENARAYFLAHLSREVCTRQYEDLLTGK